MALPCGYRASDPPAKRREAWRGRERAALGYLARSSRRLRRSAKRLAADIVFGLLVGLAVLAALRSIYLLAVTLSGGGSP